MSRKSRVLSIILIAVVLCAGIGIYALVSLRQKNEANVELFRKNFCHHWVDSEDTLWCGIFPSSNTIKYTFRQPDCWHADEVRRSSEEYLYSVKSVKINRPLVNCTELVADVVLTQGSWSQRVKITLALMDGEPSGVIVRPSIFMGRTSPKGDSFLFWEDVDM